MEVVFSDVGDRIFKRIKELGMKQLDISNKAGLSTTALSQYCTGKRVPDTVSLYKIATVLGVSMEWILTGEDITNEKSPPSPPNLEAIKREQGLSCDGLPLSEDEVDLVAMYRLLPEEQQEDVFDLVQLKYQKHVERKKGSIFWTFTGDKNGGPARSETPHGTA